MLPLGAKGGGRLGEWPRHGRDGLPEKSGWLLGWLGCAKAWRGGTKACLLCLKSRLAGAKAGSDGLAQRREARELLVLLLCLLRCPKQWEWRGRGGWLGGRLRLPERWGRHGALPKGSLDGCGLLHPLALSIMCAKQLGLLLRLLGRLCCGLLPKNRGLVASPTTVSARPPECRGGLRLAECRGHTLTRGGDSEGLGREA